MQARLIYSQLDSTYSIQEHLCAYERVFSPQQQ
jgi:hypothetical protein